ncbi:Hypothetical predicted protein [Mytilus galloprovincialis]|uniref:Fucolectin tachylectin-4 pentraxin-1 domain-containing protein n=1 Tax=Mytilus galloprovincialis TaxID=29158 RepID=A0A8B6ER09_MYTGA|nr:Hypothetical predicted protein [Mytilus galloprovincialis]
MVLALLIIINTTFKWIVIAQHNLTPYGTATQSSWLDGGIGHAQFAIQPPISNAFSMTICTHTNLSDKPAWWMFQFSFGSAFITEVQIYYRHGAAYRMDGFKLYVTNTSTVPPDGYLCYEDPDPGFPNITQTIPCFQFGKYVIYYDTKGDGTYGPLVELCYVAIYGCPRGMWGPNCNNACSSLCVNQHCHPGNGSCVYGCDPQQCLYTKCNIYTGACTKGCANGWEGQYCLCTRCRYIF